MLSKRYSVMETACGWPLECTLSPVDVVKLEQAAVEELTKDQKASQDKTKDREESETVRRCFLSLFFHLSHSFRQLITF